LASWKAGYYTEGGDQEVGGNTLSASPADTATLSGKTRNQFTFTEFATEASLKNMIAPAVLTLAAPLLAGVLLGPGAAAGLVAGATVSGVQTALSAQNSGAAWNNAKKEIERCSFIFHLAAEKAHIDPQAAGRVMEQVRTKVTAEQTRLTEQRGSGEG